MVKIMSAEALQRASGELRRTINDGGQLVVTYRRQPLARVLPAEEYELLTAELEQLRARLGELDRDGTQREAAA